MNYRMTLAALVLILATMAQGCPPPDAGYVEEGDRVDLVPADDDDSAEGRDWT